MLHNQPTMQLRIRAALATAVLLAGAVLAQVEITVDASGAGRPISPLLFGTNFNPKMESDAKIVRFMADTGLTLLRYPGGAGNFDFASGLWARKDNGGVAFTRRPEPLANFERFMQFAQRLGVAVLVEVNVGTGSPEKAAQFVRRANVDGDWHIKYWDLGNEVWLRPAGARDFIYFDDPHDYVTLIHRYSLAMKAVDPHIKLGFNTTGSYLDDRNDWDRQVLRGAAADVDYISLHWYPNHTNRDHPFPGRSDHHPDPLDLMANSLQVPRLAERYAGLLQRVAPEQLDRLSLAFTEWEGSWDADNQKIEPGTMMWSLANGLFYADALGQMAAAGVELAAHYDFQSNNFGLIRGWCREHGWGGRPWDEQTIRPKAYALQLWARHMGRWLLPATVQGAPSYQKKKDWWPDSYAGPVPYVSVWATATRAPRRVQLMIINRHPDDELSCRLRLNGFRPAAKAERRVLTGPSLRAQNDGAPGTVALTTDTWQGAAEQFEYPASPRSVTVLTLRPAD